MTTDVWSAALCASELCWLLTNSVF